jgi:parvulin-like peptidyl-prolyl isomerase
MFAKRPIVALFSCFIIAASVLTGCGVAAEKVATVDGVVITKPQYEAIYNDYAKKFRFQFGDAQEQNPMAKEMLKSLTLKKLIMNTLIQQEANKLGLAVTDADLKTLRDEQIKQVGGEDRLTKLLEQNQMTRQDFEGQIKEVALINKFLEKKGGDKLKVSDAEAEAYYKAHPKEFDMPETIRASHILVKAIDQEIRKQERDKNKNLSEDELNKLIVKKRDEAKIKAVDLEKQVKAAPDNFAKLAEKNSDDLVSGKRGGDLGPMVEKALDPTFWNAVKKTAPGQFYPGVLETQFGYHIIKVQDHTQPHHQSLAEAKPIIMNAMQTQRKMELLQKWEMEQQPKVDIETAYKPMMPGGGGEGGPQAGPMPQGKPAAPMPSAAPQPAPAHKASH